MSLDVATCPLGGRMTPGENRGVRQAPCPEEGVGGSGGSLRGEVGALTLCILASVSTMFFSTWSAFFCSWSISSDSSLLEMLQAGDRQVSRGPGGRRPCPHQRPGLPGCPQPQALSRNCPASLRWNLAVPSPPGRHH